MNTNREHRQMIYRATNCEHTLRIDISDDMTEYSEVELDRMREMNTLGNQGRELEIELWESLPGATYDALFAAIASRKTSQYRVLNEPQ